MNSNYELQYIYMKIEFQNSIFMGEILWFLKIKNSVSKFMHLSVSD